jgi:hypothetical protein
MNLLRSMRGSITAAHLAYPDVLHVELRDARGGIWRLATQDAEFTPSDPAEIVGLRVEYAEIDEDSGELRLRLSGNTLLRVTPAPQEASDDPPNWELISPHGLALEFGPGMRWQISNADAIPPPAA